MIKWIAAGLVATAILAVFIRYSPVGDTPESKPQANSQGQTPSSAADAKRAGPSNPQRGAGGNRRGGGRPAPMVVVDAVTEEEAYNRLTIVGDGKAIASVSVVPLSQGRLTDISVRAGDRVEPGQALAQLDADVERIARDRAERSLSDAQVDAERAERLYRSRTISEVEINTAKADLADAELDLQAATLALERRTVRAPIGGIVGIVTVDLGNYVTPQSELMTIDDRSSIIVQYWVPERFAADVSVGQAIVATALSRPGITYEGTVTAVDSRIDTDSRTMPVQAVIKNTDDKLRPGMSFKVSMDFDGETLPSVNPLAIQWNNNGPYVWRITEGVAERVPVSIIQRNPETVLVQGDIAVGDQLVIEGILSVRPGMEVRISGDSTEQRPETGQNRTQES